MSTCRWTGPTTPRIVTGRHDDNCPNNNCTGCQPCLMGHCRCCSHAHVTSTGTCPECMAETRDNLHQIGRMTNALPVESQRKGAHSEAAMLWGPTADPEMRQHVEGSYLAGRLPEGWIEATHGKGCRLPFNEACTGCAGDELHPLTVLGTWQMLYQDALEHEDHSRLTVASALGYLDRNLTYLSSYEHVPFEDFARDLKRCRTHLESVLHDGEQVDHGAPCMTCNVSLVRTWGTDQRADGWACPKCRQTSTEAQYRYAVMNLHRSEATHLTDRDIEIRTGVKAGTVRVWAQRGQVERKRDAGRTLYRVTDVEQQAKAAGLAS